MEKQKKILEKLQEDNRSNITDQSQIESYFNFSKPKWKKRHSILIIFETFNFAIVLAFFILSQEFLYLSIFTGIFLLSILLFIFKKSWYRYLSYLIDILGMIFTIYINSLLDIPDYIYYMDGTIISPSEIVWWVTIAISIIDLIFILNYLSIEYSRERFMSPIIRLVKRRNYSKLSGYDKWEDS